MVSKEKVEAFMLEHFPKCPICNADKGYEVSGFAKNYVQCKACGAKWQSTDFVRCEELKELELWEPSFEGKGAPLRLKKYPVSFWQNSKAIERAIIAQEAKKQKMIEKVETTVKSPKIIFDFEMTNEELQALIEKSLQEITNWDYGSTLYGKLGSLISNTSFAESATIRLLRAIFEQNKILMIQNELLRRALAKAETVTESPKK